MAHVAIEKDQKAKLGPAISSHIKKYDDVHMAKHLFSNIGILTVSYHTVVKEGGRLPIKGSKALQMQIL